MGDEELVAQLVEAALDDLPCQVRKLKDSLAAADITTSERQAHSIKGAAANIGAESLRDTAERMEKAARQGDLESCREALPVLEQNFEQLRREMEQLPQGTHHIGGQTMRTLIVEDDFICRLLLQELLKEATDAVPYCREWPGGVDAVKAALEAKSRMTSSVWIS
jgi:HPt (histidine-containing phosphotransfer) domain-containing protein